MNTFTNGMQATLTAVRRRIRDACLAAGRDPANVSLLAVSKTFPVTRIRDAIAAGQHEFGENYVQEAIDKINALAAPQPSTGTPDVSSVVPNSSGLLVWHFIGPIQSNKTRPIAENFSWVHSVDREKIARRLSEQRPNGMTPLNVCIEVNVSAESSKGGVSPTDLPALAHAIEALPRLKLRGLMTIPEPTTDMNLQRRRFAQLRELKEALAREGMVLDTLSMGMSADLEAAIAEGATIVRVGTAIFGERKT